MKSVKEALLLNSKKSQTKSNYSEKERIQLCHDHFKELLGKPILISTYNKEIKKQSTEYKKWTIYGT